MVQLLLVRKYLPKNLIYCTLGTIMGFTVGMTVYVLTNSKPVLFSVIAIVLLVQLFSVLFYDSFWDEKCKAMNQRAFEFYFEKLSTEKSIQNISKANTIHISSQAKLISDLLNGTNGSPILTKPSP